MGIGNKLDTLLKERGMTVTELARRVDVAPTTIYSIIQRNNKKVDIDVLIKISRILGVNAEYFADSIDEPQISAAPLEIEHLLKKYRDLDAHGKEMVDFTLTKEYERSIAEKKRADNIIPIGVRESTAYEVNAAHKIPGASAEDQKHDDDIMNSDDF